MASYLERFLQAESDGSDAAETVHVPLNYVAPRQHMETYKSESNRN